MCKMNQFFAVSSHTPLPATDTLLICLKFIQSASHAMLNINAAYPWLTGNAQNLCNKPWLEQKTGSHENTQTSHHEMITKPWHGWSWESSVSNTTLQLKLRVPRRISIINSFLHVADITRSQKSLFLDMWDLWSWISHLSLIPWCSPIHNTVHFCSAAFLQTSSSKNLLSHFTPCLCSSQLILASMFFVLSLP